jgi:putative SOS response-associated peptidase YedK
MGFGAVMGARHKHVGRFAKCPSGNALRETIFQALVDSRRCLIPADGFYEWRNDWRKKTPIWFHLIGKKPFAFAGLWDSWRNVELGDTLETFTIITTTANALIRQIRNRMPVIFDKERGDQWLDQSVGISRSLSIILVPFPSELMEA